MKKYMKICFPMGFVLYAIYRITERYIAIPDPIAIPILLVSILCMISGLVYFGRSIGNQRESK